MKYLKIGVIRMYAPKVVVFLQKSVGWLPLRTGIVAGIGAAGRSHGKNLLISFIHFCNVSIIFSTSKNIENKSTINPVKCG